MLRLTVTPALRAAVDQALQSASLPDADRRLLAPFQSPSSGGGGRADDAQQDNVVGDGTPSGMPIEALAALRRAGGGGQRLRSLLRGSAMEFPRRRPAPVVDPAQELRKRQQRERVAADEFSRLVASVDPTQDAQRRAARTKASVTLKSASFGLHILVGMLLGFAAGYMLAKNLYGGGQTVQVLGGIVGMVGTLVVEIALYIVREEKLHRHLEKKRQEKERSEAAQLSSGMDPRELSELTKKKT